MHKVVRSDPEDRILTLLSSTTHDCWSLSSPSGCTRYFSARMSNWKQTNKKIGCYLYDTVVEKSMAAAEEFSFVLSQLCNLKRRVSSLVRRGSFVCMCLLDKEGSWVFASSSTAPVVWLLRTRLATVIIRPVYVYHFKAVIQWYRSEIMSSTIIDGSWICQ